MVGHVGDLVGVLVDLAAGPGAGFVVDEHGPQSDVCLGGGEPFGQDPQVTAQRDCAELVGEREGHDVGAVDVGGGVGVREAPAG